MSSVPLILLNVVIPVFAVIALGALLGRRFSLPGMPLQRVAMYAAVPALALRTMSRLEVTTTAPRLVAAYMLFILAMAVAGFVLALGWRPAQRRALMATSMLGNAANVNLPVAAFAFGVGGLERALVLYVITALATFGIGPLLLGGETSVRASLARILSFPVLWAALVGIAVNALDLVVPTSIDRSISLLADAAVPVVLLALGVSIAATKPAVPSGRVLLAVAVKLLLGPVVAWGIGSTLALTGLDLAVLVLLGAMPTAINAALLAQEFDGEPEFVTQAVVISTAAALLTLPLVLHWIGPS